jgi:hypothetical protein
MRNVWANAHHVIQLNQKLSIRNSEQGLQMDATRSMVSIQADFGDV